MKKFTLNKEFLMRHAGVVLLALGMCGWFIYDGSVTYPSLSAAEFCEKYHKNAINAEHEQAEAIKRQYQFATCALIAALAIGCHLLKIRGETLEWDEKGMKGTLTGGKLAAFSDIVEIDQRYLAKKGILVVKMNDGRKITLDSWHHLEAKELNEKIVAEKA